MDIDIAFVTHLVAVGDLSHIKELGITGTMLFDDGKKVFEFIEGHVKYEKMPDKETIRHRLDIHLDEVPPEPVEYYSDLIRKRAIANLLRGGISSAIDDLENQDTTAALDSIKTVVQDVGNFGNEDMSDMGLVDLRETTDGRWESYEEAKALKGQIDGMPLPWSKINEVTLGVHPGELWFIIARLKGGKSWAQVILTNHFWHAGVKVLLVTMEMPIKKLERRIDAVNAAVSYSDLRSGTLGLEEEKRFAESLKEFLNEGMPPLWVAGNGRVSSVPDIEILISTLKPDIILIDGVYLMRVPGLKSGSKYEHVSVVVDDLQKLSLRTQLPIICTSQFTRKVKKQKLDAEAGDIGYAYEIAQNADVLIGMFQDNDLRASKRMLLRVMEHREGEDLNLLVNWDLDTMNFDEIGLMEGDDLGGDDDDDVEISY